MTKPELEEVADVDFERLVGLHDLDAVDAGVYVKRPSWPGSDEMVDRESFRFRLDGVVYVAIEDDNDSYRSSMGEFRVDPEGVVTNVFPPTKVLARHRVEGKYGGEEDDVLELVDTVTGKVVLSVGTCNIDDYYPSFESFFDPAAMAANSGQAPK